MWSQVHNPSLLTGNKAVMIRFLPNLITLLNLVSGCFAITSAFKGNVQMTIVFIAASLIFDFADGLIARLLNAYSDLGKELDSLADIVSFGVAPAFLLRWLLSEIVPDDFYGIRLIVVNLPFVLVAATAYRLARFNLDAEQSAVFKGLPAPANALLVVAFINMLVTAQWINNMSSSVLLMILIALILFQSFILVSTIPMFALKFKNYSLRGNTLRYFFIVISVIAFMLMGFSGFFPVILLYIALSAVQRAKNK